MDGEDMTIRDIREIISFAIMDGQNQIHDLKDGRATPEEVNERMFKSLDYFTTQAETAINAYILGEVMELINSCYDKDYGIDSVALRNKANKKWGKL